MKITVFSSGSSGNSTLIRTSKFNIIVDLGLSKKCITENLQKVGLTLSDIDYVFITHEHSDHIKAFPQFLRLDNIKIFISKGTLDYIYKFNFNKENNICELINKRLEQNTILLYEKKDESILYHPIELEDLRIDILPLFHDALEPVGFLFKENTTKLTYITDTGYIHKDIMPIIKNSDCYLLESNHDPEILMHSERPYPLKIRILSDHGHLSNEKSMVCLADSMGEKTKLVMHAHVSQECNLDEMIEMTRNDVFRKMNVNTDNINFVILRPYASKEYEI